MVQSTWEAPSNAVAGSAAVPSKRCASMPSARNPSAFWSLVQVPATLQPAALASLAISRPLIAQAEDEKTLCHLVRIIAARFFSRMLLFRQALFLLLALSAASPAAAQGLGSLGPLGSGPDHAKRYTECMALARSEPLKALPVAEKWHGEGGGLAARHCVAVAMFEAGRYVQAAVQFEAIARDMGTDRPGLRAELWGQAGQAFIEAGAADKAAEAQSRAIELKGNDADLWVDRGLSYAAMLAWPRAISDFDRALILQPNDVEILVLRAAAWRNAQQSGAGARRRRSTRSGSHRTIPRRCSSAVSPSWRSASATRPTTISTGCCGSCRRARPRPGAPRRACAASSRCRRRPMPRRPPPRRGGKR